MQRRRLVEIVPFDVRETTAAYAAALDRCVDVPRTAAQVLQAQLQRAAFGAIASAGYKLTGSATVSWAAACIGVGSPLRGDA